MATPNYNYEKRQRELAKKKEEKLKEREARKHQSGTDAGTEGVPQDGGMPDQDAPSSAA
jgi:hypothetical protein